MAAKWKTTEDFGITHISFIFLFFNSKPGGCQLICGIIIVNKSFSSAKAALVCSFRASGKNRRHLGCSNVMRSRGCAVQKKGITLNMYEYIHTRFKKGWYIGNKYISSVFCLFPLKKQNKTKEVYINVRNVNPYENKCIDIYNVLLIFVR